MGKPKKAHNASSDNKRLELVCYCLAIPGSGHCTRCSISGPCCPATPLFTQWQPWSASCRGNCMCASSRQTCSLHPPAFSRLGLPWARRSMSFLSS